MSIAAQCPKCGGPIAFHVASSVVTVCEHCSTVVARTDRSLEDLGKTADLMYTQSPLALWLSGTYEGVGFQITGRAQLGHSAGGVWDEWYLAFDDGRWGWLAEAQGNFYLTFEQPGMGGYINRADVTLNRALQVGNPPKVMIVSEVGTAVLRAGRGEIPYRFTIGASYDYADLSGPRGAFGTIDFGQKPAALFIGRQVTLDELGIARSESPQEHEHGMGPQVGTMAITCQNCGGALELHAPKLIERIVCPYCGGMHDTEHGALKLLQVAQRNAKKYPQVIPLGVQMLFEGETLTVIGFLTRSTKSDWETFEWQEYLLYHPRLGFRWIAVNDGHFTYLRPVSLADVRASRPDQSHYSSETADYGDKTYKIFQAGMAKVEYVAGEFYWKVNAGETTFTADYVSPPEMLSGECTADEVHWTHGTYLTRAELLACMVSGELAEVPQEGVAPNQPYRHKAVYSVWSALLVIGFVFLMWRAVGSSGNQVALQAINLEGGVPVPGETSRAHVEFSEPFRLAGGKNIEIKAYAPQLSNAWMYLQGDLYNEETGRVVQFDLPIEYYFGSDSGGSWSEGSRSAERYLSSMPAGTYTLRLTIERSNGQAPSMVSVYIRQGVFRILDWLLIMLGISIVPVCIIIHHASFERRRWSQSDFGPQSGSDGGDFTLHGD